jgi:hypothetical protein
MAAAGGTTVFPARGGEVVPVVPSPAGGRRPSSEQDLPLSIHGSPAVIDLFTMKAMRCRNRGLLLRLACKRGDSH